MSSSAANTQEQSSQLEFETLVIDNDYEISSNHYPYIIRRRSNHRVVKEYSGSGGCKYVTLNQKNYGVHRVVALQWIPNDDIENKTVIDHLNRDRSDNRLENLRWCTVSDNNRNISSHCGVVYGFEEELSDLAFEVTEYNHHTFEDLWFDPEANCFYYFTGTQYRELYYQQTSKCGLRIRFNDVNDVRTTISLSKFKKLNGLI